MRDGRALHDLRASQAKKWLGTTRSNGSLLNELGLKGGIDWSRASVDDSTGPITSP